MLLSLFSDFSRSRYKLQLKRVKLATAMATHDDPRAAQKNSADEIPIFSAENLQSNMKSIYYSRTFLSIIGGVIAGIWGISGLTGFVVYFLIMALLSLGLALKAKFSPHKYFDSWNRILFDGFFGGLMVLSLSSAVDGSPSISVPTARHSIDAINQMPSDFKDVSDVESMAMDDSVSCETEVDMLTRFHDSLNDILLSQRIVAKLKDQDDDDGQLLYQVLLDDGFSRGDIERRFVLLPQL